MVWKVLNKVPAGLMIIPMFVGIIIHSFCPGILEIGSFTTAVFSGEGAITIMGVQLLCLGSQLRMKRSTAGIQVSSGIFGDSADWKSGGQGWHIWNYITGTGLFHNEY